MRFLVILATCVVAALAHGTTQPQAVGGADTAAVRTEPTFGVGAGVRVGGGSRVGGGRIRGGGFGGGIGIGGGGYGGGRFGRGRWGRGYGGYGGWRGRYGGWIYPGIEEVVVAPGYEYGLGGYGVGGGYGMGYGQPGYTVVQQPPVVVAQQPGVVLGGASAAAAAPTATTTVYAPPMETATTAETTTATTAAAPTTIVEAAPPTVVHAEAPPTVVAQAPPTIVAQAPAASGFVAAAGPTQIMTTQSIVPELTYASPYYFGAGSRVVYPGYMGRYRGWYGRLGRRFGAGRFGLGRFGLGMGGLGYGYGAGYGAGYPYYGGGGILTGGGIGVGLPPIYVGGRIGGGRFRHRRGRLEAEAPAQQPPQAPQQPAQQPLMGEQFQALAGEEQQQKPGTSTATTTSLPFTTIKTDTPSETIMTLGGADSQPAKLMAGGDSYDAAWTAGEPQALSAPVTTTAVSAAQPMAITAAVDPSKIQNVDVTATVLPRSS